MALWKSVENVSALGMGAAVYGEPLQPAFCGEPPVSLPPLRACSACAGDYEDPDRTAGTPDEEDEYLALESTRVGANEKTENNADGDDEFPAKES
jgi:hypothetical protein